MTSSKTESLKEMRRWMCVSVLVGDTNGETGEKERRERERESTTYLTVDDVPDDTLDLLPRRDEGIRRVAHDIVNLVDDRDSGRIRLVRL